MATYTPSNVIAPTVMSASAGTSLLTGTSGHNYIMRTISVIAPSSGAGKTFTLSIGADAVGTRIFDTYAIPTNAPAFFNGWYIAPSTGAAHAIDGNCSSTAGGGVTIYAAGYDQI